MTAPTDVDNTRVRLTVLVVVVACLFAALFARLWFLQVINAPLAQEAAASNGVQTISIAAPRGEILDRNGNVLVGNVNEPVIAVSRQTAVADPAMLGRLAALLNTTTTSLNSLIKDDNQVSPYASVPVAQDATPQQILYIQENQGEFPGVAATTESVRTYTPMGKAAANIVGYVGQISPAEYKQLKSKGYQPTDQIGLAGVEQTYEQYLRGTPGKEEVQVNSQGQVLGVLRTIPPVPGDNITLSISGPIQMEADSALEAGLTAARTQTDTVTHRKFTAPAGAAVVEDPQDGTVLALATEPSYDPTEWVGGISTSNYQALTNPAANNPLLNRAIQGEYAPGSTFKLVTATAGLQDGLVTPGTSFHDTGSITIGGEKFTNDNGESYGYIDLTQAIIVSSDNYFNTIGGDLWDGYVNGGHYPETALQNVAASYGFGNPTGIALPGEAAGIIPTPALIKKQVQQDPSIYGTYSGWLTGYSVQMAIGEYEDLVTPLQLANAYSTFANGGTLWTPRIALSATPASGKVITFTSAKKGSVTLSAPDRAAMLAGFDGVVNNPEGTAYGVFHGSPVAAEDIAGKTGTAQVSNANVPLAQQKQDTSVFTSFAPATNPQYVVDAFMEQSGYGASIAAPVVRQIYDALYNLPLEPITYTAASGVGGQN